MSRKAYNRQFKIAAVQLVLEENMFLKKVSRELSIHFNTLYRWIGEYEESAFSGSGSALSHSQYEMKRLKHENEVLSEEIQQIFEEHKGQYRSLKTKKVPKKNSIKANQKRVSKLIRLMKLYAKSSHYRYKHYNKKSPSIEKSNLLN
ncbi:transposase [Bacillus thuringiensis]|uniref:Transposase n=1 Tax=Bacillus cereus TaxID=1396 RepID=A0A9W7Q3J2_BACCE|nr:transposase [Bacillus cereus]KAA6460464.1 hypothetical protein DX932_19835 [Bacillus cereus]KAB2500208.1 transposase [Bacillus cereus]